MKRFTIKNIIKWILKQTSSESLADKGIWRIFQKQPQRIAFSFAPRLKWLFSQDKGEDSVPSVKGRSSPQKIHKRMGKKVEVVWRKQANKVISGILGLSPSHQNIKRCIFRHFHFGPVLTFFVRSPSLKIALVFAKFTSLFLSLCPPRLRYPPPCWGGRSTTSCGCAVEWGRRCQQPIVNFLGTLVQPSTVFCDVSFCLHPSVIQSVRVDMC